MKVNYNVTGKERKRLAQTIGKAIGVDAIYKGVPACAYEIDYFTVDREGSLIFDDAQDSNEVEQVFDAIAAAGFEPQDSGDNECGIAIQMPMMSGDEISRLKSLIESKESLIRKAIGADSLMVGEKEGKPCYFGAVYEHLDNDLSSEGTIGLAAVSDVEFEDYGHEIAWAMQQQKQERGIHTLALSSIILSFRIQQCPRQPSSHMNQHSLE